MERSLLFGNSPSVSKERSCLLKTSGATNLDQSKGSDEEERDWTVEFPYVHPSGFEDDERYLYFKSNDSSNRYSKGSRQSRIDDYIEKDDLDPCSPEALFGAECLSKNSATVAEVPKSSKLKKKLNQGKNSPNGGTRRRKKRNLKSSFDTIFSPIYTFFQKTTVGRNTVTMDDDINVELPNESTNGTNSAPSPMVVEESLDHHTTDLISETVNVEYVEAAASPESVLVLQDTEPYEFIAALPNANDVSSFPSLCIPSRHQEDPKVTLVLDLDETLVHCSTESLADPDLVFPVYFGGSEYRVYAKKRPFLDFFLSEVRTLFEVIVFTASQQAYADTILNLLDPSREYFRHRAFRDSCVLIEGNFLKDLRVLGRDLRKCVILDNSPQAFGLQIENGIPISTWIDDANDRELVDLLPLLKQLAGCEDVRPLLRRKFGLVDIVQRYRSLLLSEKNNFRIEEEDRNMVVTVR
eukprot:jgi/Galph1/2112/GphlegSOOS_G799.1